MLDEEETHSTPKTCLSTWMCWGTLNGDQTIPHRMQNRLMQEIVLQNNKVLRYMLVYNGEMLERQTVQ